MISRHGKAFDTTCHCDMMTSLFTTGFIMMTSSNGNIFCVTGILWGEFPCHRWIPLTKANGAVLLYFLFSAPEQTVESKPRRWWFETPSSSLFRYCNECNPGWVPLTHKGQRYGALMLLAWKRCWTNGEVVGDLVCDVMLCKKKTGHTSIHN